jgi:MFS family permease
VLNNLRDRTYYGWWIVGAGFLNQLIASAVLQRSYGSYLVLLREDFGWSKAALSGAYSLQQVESGFIGPVQGWLIDRFGPRFSMLAGCLLFGAGMIMFSQVQTLTHFYIAYTIIALGSSLGGFFPISVVIVNWFERRRSRALSTMQIGGAIGGFLVPMIALLLEAYGWRDVAFFSGFVIIAVGVPMAFIVRRRPEDYGLVVDGGPAPAIDALDGSAVTIAPANAPERDFTIWEAMRTPAFWLISLGHGSALLVVSVVNVHIVVHVKEGLGYSLTTASFVVTMITVAQIGGMLVAGAIGDRFDKRLIAVGCMAMHTTALLLAAYAVAFPMLVVFATMHGVAWGLRGPLMQAIRADYFGRTSYGMIMGVSSLIVMLGTISGPLVAGFLADTTGSYRIGFTILALLSGLGSVFFLAAKRPQPPTPREPFAEAEALGVPGA